MERREGAAKPNTFIHQKQMKQFKYSSSFPGNAPGLFQAKFRKCAAWPLLLVLLSTSAGIARAQSVAAPNIVDGVGIWGEPGGIPASPYFTLTVNSHPVQVREWDTTTSYTSQKIAVARFCTTGAWDAQLTASEIISSITIRPKSRGITASGIGTKTATFHVNGADKLYVEINGLPPLCIFATPVIPLPPAGANVRVIPGGIQNLGTLNLVSGQTIWLNPSSVLVGRISASGVSNVRVAGYGIIKSTDTTVSNAIYAYGSSNVDLEGVFVCHSGAAWTVLLNQSSGTVKDLSVLSFDQNGDGIDTISVNNVTIQNCFVRTVDDCISVKNTTTGKSSGNVTVSGCTCYGYINGDGVTVGHESFGLISGVNVSNCDVIGAGGSSNAPSGRHSAFSVINYGPGGINNVTFDNIRCEDKVTVNDFEAAVRQVSAADGGVTGHISGVTVKNIVWATNKPLYFTSYSSANRVTTVPMSNCQIAGRYLTATDSQIHTTANVQNLTVDGVTVASPKP